MALRTLAPFLQILSISYFSCVHFGFWLFNYLFKQRIVVPRPSEDEHNQLLLISAVQAAEMIRRKEITCSLLIEVYIRRIRTINPVLNAVIRWNFDEALKEAKEIDEWLTSANPDSAEYKRKPLWGVPFTCKDSIRVKGFKSSIGIPVMEDEDGPNQEDAVVISRMREAGAIPLVITNVPEACLWWQTCNTLFGQTCSPYDSRRGVGGSSGGEGCLVAAAGSVVGLGSDIGGSVRIPAFFNGVFGLKPGYDNVPSKGHIPDQFHNFQERMFSIGPICRYARDLTVMLKVLVGPTKAKELKLDVSVPLPRTRVFYMNGLRSFLSSPLHSDCANALTKAIKYFEKKYDIPSYNVNLPIANHALGLWLSSMHDDRLRFGDVLNGFKEHSHFNPFLEMVWFFLGRSRHTFMALLTAILDDLPDSFRSDRDYVISKREQLRREVESLLGTDGILLFPGFARPAYFHNEGVFSPFDYQYTAIWNTLGLPVVTCPLGLNSEGLPVGVQVVGGPNSEALLIAVAQDLEEGFGGWTAPSRN